jgi:hypothetical protein
MHSEPKLDQHLHSHQEQTTNLPMFAPHQIPMIRLKRPRRNSRGYQIRFHKATCRTAQMWRLRGSDSIGKKYRMSGPRRFSLDPFAQENLQEIVEVPVGS